MSEFETSKADEELVAALRRGIGESDPVPDDVAGFARAVFAWREIDAALAELDFDSAEEPVPSGVRSSATARMVSFQAGQWMLDVEYDETSGRLIGAVTPQAEFTLDLHTAGGFSTIRSDESGRFEAEGVTPGPVSLVLRFGRGETIKTRWVIL